jgi:hypothetical protein
LLQGQAKSKLISACRVVINVSISRSHSLQRTVFTSSAVVIFHASCRPTPADATDTKPLTQTKPLTYTG